MNVLERLRVEIRDRNGVLFDFGGGESTSFVLISHAFLCMTLIKAVVGA